MNLILDDHREEGIARREKKYIFVPLSNNIVTAIRITMRLIPRKMMTKEKNGKSLPLIPKRCCGFPLTYVINHPQDAMGFVIVQVSCFNLWNIQPGEHKDISFAI